MPSSREVIEWMHKIQEWNPKFFTLAHIPEKYRLTVTRFVRRVVIARMAETPEMAAAYHRKLREAYETEDKLKKKTVVFKLYIIFKTLIIYTRNKGTFSFP